LGLIYSNYNEVIIGRGYTKQFGHKLSNKTGLISALEWFDLSSSRRSTQSGDNRLNSINNPKKKQMEYEYRF
jgi:hypothetical protein